MVVELGKCINFEDLYKTPYFGKHISDLYDKVTGGAIKSQVHLFVAGSGVGKTRTGVSVCCELLKQGWSVGYLTFEQTKEQIAELIIDHFAAGECSKEQTFDKIKNMPCYIKRFENNSIDNVIAVINQFKGYDAVIFDYLALPDESPAESFNASVTGLRIIKQIKKIAEENNQFIWCMAQGKTKEDKDAFSSVDDIWISRQLINPVEVAVVANKVNKELLNLDFIKVRYPRGYSRCRLLRSFDYKTCKATDVELMTETGEKLDDEEV